VLLSPQKGSRKLIKNWTVEEILKSGQYEEIEIVRIIVMPSFHKAAFR
jgi:hypothetical protein